MSDSSVQGTVGGRRSSQDSEPSHQPPESACEDTGAAGTITSTAAVRETAGQYNPT